MKVLLVICLLGASMCLTPPFVFPQEISGPLIGASPLDFFLGVLKGLETKAGFTLFPEGKEEFHTAKLEFGRMVQHIKGGNTTEALWYGWHAVNACLDGFFDWMGALQYIKMDLDELVNMVDGHMTWDELKQHFLISALLNAQEILNAAQDAFSNVKAGDWYKLGFDVGVILMDVAFNTQGF